MRLAFSVPTRSDAEQELLFNSYKGSGYEGLQLKSGQYLSYLDDPRDAEAVARDDPGRFSGLIFGGTLDYQGQEMLRKVIHFASRVSSERVIFCHQYPHNQTKEDDIRSFAAILSRLGNEAVDLGIRLSLHHHYEQPVMFPRDIQVFFDAALPGAVGLTVDTAHMWMSGQDDVGSVVCRFADVLDNVHLKDCRDQSGDRLPNGARASTSFMPLGKGDMDFAPIFSAISQTGYSGWLCVDEESGADLGGSLRSSQEFISGHLARASSGKELLG